MGSKITYWKQMRGLLSTLPSAVGVMPTANLGSGVADNTTFLRGDQTYAVPVPATGSITLAMMANVPTSTVFYRRTAGTGPVTTHTLATLKLDLGLTTAVTLAGTSDTTQLDITPFATQTVNQSVWRTTAGVASTWVDANGRLVAGAGSWTLNNAFHSLLWSGGSVGWASTGSVTATTAIETGMTRDGGAGLVGIRNSTTPHDVRIYNTFTSASIYERGHIGFHSNVFTVGSYAAGGGTLRGINFGVSGNSIGFYGATPVARPTTAGAAATFVANAGTAVNDASTFDGYTIRQVVSALRSLGLLT